MINQKKILYASFKSVTQLFIVVGFRKSLLREIMANVYVLFM